MTDKRPIAIITGACGGMGQACARVLGRSHRLVLNDIDEARLAAFGQALVGEGHDVAARHHGDLAERGNCVALVRAATTAGRLGSIVHAAGVSPATGSWETIVRANLIGTEQLFQEIESCEASGYSAVVIASMSGHMARDDAAIDGLFDAPLAPDLLVRAEAVLAPHVKPNDQFGLGSVAYSHTKSANLRMVRARSTGWARRGNRIVSVSPGTVRTPMGMAEASANPLAQAVLDATPIGRWGSVLDIAMLVEFLCSDKAGFITGTDILIDGGVTAALKLGQLLG